MVDTETVIQTVADHKGDDDIVVHQVSDDSMERAADVERLGAVTLAFCSGLDTCPS
jgi:hypothetical protein